MSRRGTWTDEERKFMHSCDSFKDHSGIEEYKEDIKKCLILSSWGYTQAEAEHIVASEQLYIEKAFNEKVPSGDAAIDIGYICG